MEAISTTNCFDTIISSRHLPKLARYTCIMILLYVRKVACQLTVANFTVILAVSKFHSLFIHAQVHFHDTSTKQCGHGRRAKYCPTLFQY